MQKNPMVIVMKKQGRNTSRRQVSLPEKSAEKQEDQAANDPGQGCIKSDRSWLPEYEKVGTET